MAYTFTMWVRKAVRVTAYGSYSTAQNAVQRECIGYYIV